MIRRTVLASFDTDLASRGQPRTLWTPSRRAVIGCAAVVGIGGLVVLSGWAFGIARLKNLSPGVVSMKPNAAAALVLYGLALAMCGHGRRGSRSESAMATAAATLGAAIGVVTVVEYLSGANLGIDQLVFHEAARGAGTVSPGRMALVTAIALVLAGGSLVSLRWGRVRTQQALAGAVSVIVLSALLGYLYGTDLTKPWGTTEISAYTVALLAVLAVGLLAARPEAGFVGALLGDTPGGLMARWLLLVAVIVLPALGAVRLAGQHAGLYSARAGVGIMVLASLLVLLVTVSATAIRLNAFGSERALALERLAESDRRLRRALEHLLRVQENERRGLATDLHDDALPALSGIGLQLELAREECDDDDARERLGQAEAELRAVRVRLRHLMLDLVPDALEREGLPGALRHRLEQMEELRGIQYELVDRLGRQPSPVAAAVLYRIAVEALRNVARHANAKRVRVELHRNGDRLCALVADNGVGFRPSVPRPGHLGLSIMSARAELAGGGIDIDSGPGRGTSLAFWVPAGVEQVLETG